MNQEEYLDRTQANCVKSDGGETLEYWTYALEARNLDRIDSNLSVIGPNVKVDPPGVRRHNYELSGVTIALDRHGRGEAAQLTNYESGNWPHLVEV